MKITTYNPHSWLLPGPSAFRKKTDYPVWGQPRYEINQGLQPARRDLRSLGLAESRRGVRKRTPYPSRFAWVGVLPTAQLLRKPGCPVLAIIWLGRGNYAQLLRRRRGCWSRGLLWRFDRQ